MLLNLAIAQGGFIQIVIFNDICLGLTQNLRTDVILYGHADIFAQADPIQYQIALDILNSAKEYWESHHIRMKFVAINKCN
jgi:hypothetical protein